MSTTIQESLLPFIPLLYIAWADGILEKDEIIYIEKQIKENDTLKPEIKKISTAKKQKKHSFFKPFN